MIQVQFYGYNTTADTLRKSQMILAQAERKKNDGDIDAWFYAGCPVGKAYSKWSSRSGPTPSEMGRKGGKVKTAKGFSTMDPARRSEIAKAAAAKRWASKKKV
jgi:hypothetical protein